jgi:hypothetical protein
MKTEMIASIEADCDLAQLTHAWATAFNIGEEVDVYPACPDQQIVNSVFAIARETKHKNKYCVLAPNADKKCLIHGRSCRHKQILHPICDDYHMRQRAHVRK